MGDIVQAGMSLFGIETPAERAAKEAAGVQERLGREAIAEQRAVREELAPFREAGVGALQEQQALLGLAGRGAQEEAFGRFAESPGQAFLRQRGEQAITRQASALGGLGGGRVREALQQQGIGVAQQDLQNQLARLSGLSGAGQQAIGTGAGITSQIGQQLGQIGQAQAGGILGAQQARAQTGSQFAGAGLGALAGGGVLGKRVQTAFGGTSGAGALLGLL
jgi:hypothetical protein